MASVDGGANNDTLLLETAGADVTLTATGFDADVTGVTSGVDNFETLNATNGGTLTGLNAVNVWDIDATPTYNDSSNTLNFSGFANLTGHANTDDFNVLDGGSVTGILDGQGGSDTLDYGAYTSTVLTTITGIGSTDGFAGTSTATGGFDDIDVITGGTTGTDILTGDDAASVWTLAAGQTYASGVNTATFSAFETLQGGLNTDQFDVDANNALNLLGGAGMDSFDRCRDRIGRQLGR